MSRQFFLSVALLRKHNACLHGQTVWTNRFGHGDVLVTPEVARFIGRNRYADWVVRRMKLSAGQDRRHADARQAYFDTRAGSQEERTALAALNALYTQLIIEGPGGAA